jgi:hypothetical protein
MSPRALILVLLAIPVVAQIPRAPDLETQRAAMKKLDFLVGKWSGEAHVQRGAGEPDALIQTEEAQYKLDGLILVIEGVGRNKSDGKTTLRAYGIVSYDDAAGTYHMRAFNDGRFLETDVRLLEQGKGFAWGFGVGQIKTSSVMRISEAGEWTELTEITLGAQAPRKYMDVRVSKQ